MGYRYAEDGLTKLEYGCFLAAALAFLMIRQQDPVGLVTFDEQIRRFLPPRSSTRHLNRLLQCLEGVEAGNATNIGETFHELAERIRKRGLIIIVSDLLDAAEQKELIRGLRHFKHKKHEVLLFHVLDHAEINFPFERLSEFIDLETGERLQADPAYVKQEYQRQVREFIEACRRDCASGNIDYVLADTTAPYDLLLRAYLDRRKRYG